MRQTIIDAIESEIRHEAKKALRKAIENLRHNQEQRFHLLENRMMFDSTHGEAFDRIYNQRMKLWNQVKAYNTAITAIYHEYNQIY